MENLPLEFNEFDMKFFINNPGISKSRKFCRQNFEKVKHLCSLDDEYQEFYVNMPYNNVIREQKPVLARGQLKPKDAENFGQGENLPQYEHLESEMKMAKQFEGIQKLHFKNKTQIQGVLKRIQDTAEEINTKKLTMKNFFREYEQVGQNDDEIQPQQVVSQNSNKQDSFDFLIEESHQFELEENKLKLVQKIKDLIENSNSIMVSQCSSDSILRLISQLEKMDLKYSFNQIQFISCHDYSSLQEMIELYNQIGILCRDDSLNNPSNSSDEFIESEEFEYYFRKQGSSKKDSVLSWKSKLSMNRKMRLEALQLEYYQYLRLIQSNFVTRCQMINVQCLKNKKNSQYLLKNTPENVKFKITDIGEERKTLAIDVENTLVTKLDIQDLDELDKMRKLENYIFTQEEREFPIVYMVRPYTLDMLRALQPFYEIIAFANMSDRILYAIIKHIEDVLYLPIRVFGNGQEQISVGSSNDRLFSRVQFKPESVPIFNFILHKDYYVTGAYDFPVENLQFLLHNRLKENIILISSNPQRIVVALSHGFSVLPVIPFERFYRDDYQLNLLENHLLRFRHRKDMVEKMKHDFQYLLQQVHKETFKPFHDEEEEKNEHSPRFRSKSYLKNSESDSDLEDDEKPMKRQGLILSSNERVVYDANVVILEEGSSWIESVNPSNKSVAEKSVVEKSIVEND